MTRSEMRSEVVEGKPLLLLFSYGGAESNNALTHVYRTTSLQEERQQLLRYRASIETEFANRQDFVLYFWPFPCLAHRFFRANGETQHGQP
jgi:hypothetical protein